MFLCQCPKLAVWRSPDVEKQENIKNANQVSNLGTLKKKL
jgi:hypothetical protein